ncbi:MAG: hypothetical protein KGZ58_07805 [Ignavibacteriales bacterium]|nr:hypothetical protein [Ignavibacteriales bacterium]
MTKNETIERNITLTFDFLRQVVNDPSIIDDIPNGSTIEFVQKDLPIAEEHIPHRAKTSTRYLKVNHQFEHIKS